MKRKRRIIKAYSERAIKKSVSMPRRWFEMGCGRQQMLGYSTFSDYIQHLVRQDVVASGESIPIPGLPKHLRPQKK